MRTQIAKIINGTIITIILLVLSSGTHVFSQASSSPNYEVDQVYFGTGSQDASSSNYQSQATVGDLGIGFTSSANYGAYAGFNTTDEPYLEFVVTGNNIDLDYLETTQTKTANGTFYVRAWQASGYSITTESSPPENSNQTHSLSPMAIAGGPVTGTEQFGINLVANTVPTSFGADPQQVPDNTFSFGQVASGYDTANNYKYVKGETVAESSQSTSVTIYTMSYIFNIEENTPSGQYTFNHILVATATY